MFFASFIGMRRPAGWSGWFKMIGLLFAKSILFHARYALGGPKMHALNVFKHLDMLEDACAKITDKFQVERGQIEKLLTSVSILKKNQDAFIPQIAICGDHNVGKTTLAKFLFHDLWPDMVQLPGSDTASMGAPTVIRFVPGEPGAHTQQRAQFATNYFTREEYIDAVLWTLENLIDQPGKKTEQAIVEARASRSLDDIRKACEAALNDLGGDKSTLRKHFRLVADDCRETQKIEDAFSSLKAQNHVKQRMDIAELQAKETDVYGSLVKSVTITVSVEPNMIPCAFQVVDLPGLNTDQVLSMHYAVNFAQKHADAFVVCLSSAEPNLDDATVRYLSKIIGRDSQSSSRASAAGDGQDARFSETVLENLISTHHWAEPGLSSVAQSGASNIFVIDPLAGVMHDLRSASNLNSIAHDHLGVADDHAYKAIKKKWNSGRVGQDNTSLKLQLLKFITYQLPKENFQAVKSASIDLIAKYKSIVASIKPEQSKWHMHSLNTLQHDARTRFDDCTSSVEGQLDILHRTLRHDIISKLNATLAVGDRSEAREKKPAAPAVKAKVENSARGEIHKPIDNKETNGPKLVAQ